MMYYDIRTDLQKKMGFRDLRTTKEFITRKSYADDQLTQDEEKVLDALNRQVCFFWSLITLLIHCMSNSRVVMVMLTEDSILTRSMMIVTLILFLVLYALIMKITLMKICQITN